MLFWFFVLRSSRAWWCIAMRRASELLGIPYSFFMNSKSFISLVSVVCSAMCMGLVVPCFLGGGGGFHCCFIFGFQCVSLVKL